MQAPERLLDILSYKRPAGSDAEADFIERFLGHFHRDDYGNRYVVVGDDSPILWSCHTDTVHHKDGRQHVFVAGDGHIRLSKPKRGKCLGADDGAGIWLMLEMIDAGVPGTYVFHREEERGGGGSLYIAERMNLEPYKFAIALDRAGYDSVITHQGGGRCCSDAFAEQLAQLLGGTFKPDSTGVFTDTANYVDVIGECTNLSVGYHRQHGPTESQDLKFLLELRDKLVSTDWSQLEAHREAGEMDEEELAWLRIKDRKYDPPWWAETDWRAGGLGSVLRFVEDHPEFIADLLEQHGYDREELERAHSDYMGLSRRYA